MSGELQKFSPFAEVQLSRQIVWLLAALLKTDDDGQFHSGQPHSYNWGRVYNKFDRLSSSQIDLKNSWLII